MMSCLSVVIHDLDLSWSLISPHETDTELIVDPDTVLPGTIADERLQPISRWRTEKVQRYCGVKHLQFAFSCVSEICKPRNALPLVKGLGIFALEAKYHGDTL